MAAVYSSVILNSSVSSEVWHKLYPDWRGKFKNGAPSLDTLDNNQVNEALTHGLLSKDSLVSLLNLITTPDVSVLLV
jgi:hypothetical protein